MKAMFGVVSLVVALAIIGLLMVKQLKAVGHVAAPVAGAPAAPAMSGSGTVRDQAVQLENKVANDVVKAMQQGAASRGGD